MPFIRERVRHELTARRLTVARVQAVTPAIVRVTFTGEQLAGFASVGPADHVKVFFPDPVTGVLHAPTATPEGIQPPPAGSAIARDYTPLAFRPAGDGSAGAGQAELDIDFVLHGDDGPASVWAARARAGDELTIAGPRGSALAPEGIERLVLVVDETALPAASRWIATVGGRGIPVQLVVSVADASGESYFAELPESVSVQWLRRSEGAELDAALRALAPFDDGTYLFLAGEAGTLTPLRRYLRRELGLPADQVSVSGYWRHGVVALDHHAPVDFTDPD